jgi:hypothetical protein
MKKFFTIALALVLAISLGLRRLSLYAKLFARGVSGKELMTKFVSKPVGRYMNHNEIIIG